MCKIEKINLLNDLKHLIKDILPKGVKVKTNSLKLTIYEAKTKTFNIRITKDFKKFDIDVLKEFEIIKSKLNYLL